MVHDTMKSGILTEVQTSSAVLQCVGASPSPKAVLVSPPSPSRKMVDTGTDFLEVQNERSDKLDQRFAS